MEAYEGEGISWVRMAERGGEYRKFHLHALLAQPRRVSIQKATQIWRRIAGSAIIGPYDPDRRGMAYMLKSIEDTPDFDFDASLFTQHRRNEDSSSGGGLAPEKKARLNEPCMR